MVKLTAEDVAFTRPMHWTTPGYHGLRTSGRLCSQLPSSSRGWTSYRQALTVGSHVTTGDGHRQAGDDVEVQGSAGVPVVATNVPLIAA